MSKANHSLSIVLQFITRDSAVAPLYETIWVDGRARSSKKKKKIRSFQKRDFCYDCELFSDIRSCPKYSLKNREREYEEEISLIKIALYPQWGMEKVTNIGKRQNYVLVC